MEFKRVSRINRYTTVLKLRSQRLLMFSVQKGHNKFFDKPQGYHVKFLKKSILINSFFKVSVNTKLKMLLWMAFFIGV